MTRTRILPLLLLGALAAGALLALTAKRPAALAAATTAPAGGQAADALSGKLYPLSLKTEQVDSTFHMADLVDPQGKPGTYVTKGQLVSIGGENFLVAYGVSPTASIGSPPQLRANTTLPLALINVRDIEVILDLHDVAPATAGTDTPVPGTP